jgi:Transposase DDE domain group 1
LRRDLSKQTKPAKVKMNTGSVEFKRQDGTAIKIEGPAEFVAAVTAVILEVGKGRSSEHVQEGKPGRQRSPSSDRFEGLPAMFSPQWQEARPLLLGRLGRTSTVGEVFESLSHQEGVKIGYTRKGLKPCLHPLLAVLEEAKLVVQFWLRAGNAPSASNVVNFTLDLLANLPRHIRLKVVRADCGFCEDPWLNLLESRGLRYIVVAKLNIKIQKIIKKDLQWSATAIPGTEVAQMNYQGRNWSRARRLILIRHRVEENNRSGGKVLLDCPGYHFQALVTNLPFSVEPIEVWRDYNGRAGIERVIKELDYGFGLPQLCCAKFWATESGLVAGGANLQSEHPLKLP